jgi:tape measure domain-containing protein
MATIGSLYVIVGAQTGGLTSGLRSAEAAVDRFSSRSLKSIAAVNNASFARLQSSLLNLQTLFTAGIIGGGISEIIKTGIAFERLEYKMIAATGGMQNAAGELAFVRAEAERLGLRLKDAADMFGTIAASAKDTVIQGQTVRDIFTSISEAGTVLRLSSEDVKGALYAISQMISKGKVSMEELRQQLGERLPGALLIAQRAMGMTGVEFDKLVSKGTLLAEDFLPKLSQEIRNTFADAIPEAIKSTQSEINRFLTSWDDMLNEMAKGGFIEAMRHVLRAATATFKAISWGVTSLVAFVLRGWEQWRLGASQVFLSIEYAFKNTWEGIVSIFTGGLRKIADGIDWINRLLNGMGAASSTGGIRKLADEMDAAAKGPIVSYADAIKQTQKEYALAMEGIDDVMKTRYQALYGEAPAVPPAMAAGTQSGKGGGPSAAELKRLDKIADMRRKLEADINSSGLKGFGKTLADVTNKTIDLKAEYPELLKEIEVWQEAVLRNEWAQHEAEQFSIYVDSMKKAKEDAQAIAEQEINTNLFKIDMAQQDRVISQGEAVKARITEYQKLLTVQEQYLSGMKKGEDVSGWNSQITAIQTTQEQLAMLGQEYDRIYGGFIDGVKEKMAQLQDQMATFYEQGMMVAQEFSSAFGEAFESIVFDATSVSDAIGNMARTIARSMVNTLGQIAAQWLVLQAVQMMSGKTVQAANVTAAAAAGPAIAASYAPAAAMVSLASWGANSAPAMAGITATNTLAMALASTSIGAAGMAHKGLDSVPEDGTWNLEKGERVVTSQTSAKLDKVLSDIQQNSQANAGGSSENKIRIINAFDTEVVGDYIGSDSGEQKIMNVVRRNASTIKQFMG